MEKDLLEVAAEKFQQAKDTWIDLPEYVYSEEYKKAFMFWIKENIDHGKDDMDQLVIWALHHETGNRQPYFEFQRA
jgi:hypothetical protein